MLKTQPAETLHIKQGFQIGFIYNMFINPVAIWNIVFYSSSSSIMDNKNKNLLKKSLFLCSSIELEIL